MSERNAGIAICIPTLNEAANIGSILQRLCSTLEGRNCSDYSICVVDDGSLDGTREIVMDAAKQNAHIYLLEGTHSGAGCKRGLASRRGLEWLIRNTGHTVFVDMDADGSQRPEELFTGVDLLMNKSADVVIASKYAKGAKVTGRPLLRTVASRFYSMFLRFTMPAGILDYSNSYRFYTLKAAEMTLKYPVRYEGPMHLLEMLAVWLSNGLTVLEYPALYEERVGGTSKVTLGDLANGASGAFDILLKYRRGYYSGYPGGADFTR